MVRVEARLGVYRPRHPENTPFYRCLDEHWEEFERGYEILFQKVPVSHRQVVFTIPKALRGWFRRDRRLLGQLCCCAWQTLAQMYQTAFPEEDVRGGAVIAIQTAGDRLQWHPLCGAPHKGCYVKRCVM